MKRGASLVELVLTISLLAIVFLVILNLVPSVIFGGVEARHRLLAGQIAGEILDTCAAGPFSNLQIGTYSPSNPGRLAGYLNDVTSEDQVVFRPEVTVAAVSGLQPKHVKRVLAVVRWKERNKELHVARVRSISGVRR
jgi:hypothetical protein